MPPLIRTLAVAVILLALIGGAVVWLRPAEVTTRQLPTDVARSVMGPLEPATNRPGRDIAELGTRVDSASRCADFCARNPACQAMSFAKAAEAADGICWLKWAVPAPTESAAMVSAVRIASAPASGR